MKDIYIYATIILLVPISIAFWISPWHTISFIIGAIFGMCSICAAIRKCYLEDKEEFDKIMNE